MHCRRPQSLTGGSSARRDDDLDRLPLPYAIALRLRGAGVTDGVIADAVGVDPDALPTFMRVAEAKRAAVQGPPA